MYQVMTAALFAAGLASLAHADEPPGPLGQARSRFAEFDKIRVYYKSFGEGRSAVVFIHGFACDMLTWRFQVPAFAGKARVLLIDLPGHGQSDKPEAGYSMDLFARATVAVLTHAGVEKV